MPEVIRQNWLESERGWGTRPDGYSLHLNDEDRKSFITDFNATLPAEVPDEYSRPEGKAWAEEVNQEMFDKVKASKNGVRIY